MVMLALHGYDVYGLEVSPTGVEKARAYAAAQLAAPSEYNFSSDKNQEQYLVSERGQVKFVTGDFFTKDWEANCCMNGEDFIGFDLIYDYTVSTIKGKGAPFVECKSDCAQVPVCTPAGNAQGLGPPDE